MYFFFFKEILDGQRSGDQLKRSRRKGRNRQEVPAFAEPDATVEVKTPFDLAKVSAYRMSFFWLYGEEEMIDTFQRAKCTNWSRMAIFQQMYEFYEEKVVMITYYFLYGKLFFWQPA